MTVQNFLYFLVFLSIFSSVLAQNENCTRICDEKKNTLKKIQICTNHGTNVEQNVDHAGCYNQCNVTTLYPSTCACPNSCYESFNQGKCTTSGCLCNENWTGKDCSIQKIPSVISTGLSNLPFGEIYPYSYLPDDIYKDNHPIFNISTIAKVYIDVKPHDLKRIIGFDELWEAKPIPGKFRFINGIYDMTLEDVGLKVKGAYSRSGRKKGWKLDFVNKRNPDRRFFGMEKLGFKGQDYGSGSNSYIASQIIRSLGAHSQRSSFAQLFINEVNYGLYWMAEEIDVHFFKSRYPTVTKESGMYKVANLHGTLGYRGNKTKDYRDYEIYRDSMRRWFNVYDRKLGKDNWKMFIDFVSFLHHANNVTFAEDLKKIFNVDLFLRYEAVHTTVLNSDSYTLAQNNFVIWENLNTSKVEHLSLDFDDIFSEDLEKLDPYLFYTKAKESADLTRLVLNTPEFRKIYSIYLHDCIKLLSSGLIQKELKKLNEILEPIVEHDLFYTLDEDRDVDTFREYMGLVSIQLEKRIEFLLNTTDKINFKSPPSSNINWLFITLTIIVAGILLFTAVLMISYGIFKYLKTKTPQDESYDRQHDEDIEME